MQCDATTLRGITNSVDIIWSTGSIQVRRSNNVVGRDRTGSTVYNDLFTIQSLNLSDIGNIYQCEVLINSIVPTASKTNFIIPFPITGTNNYIVFCITLHILNSCMHTKYIRMHLNGP